ILHPNDNWHKLSRVIQFTEINFFHSFFEYENCKMSAIRIDLVHVVVNRAFGLTVYNDFHKFFEIARQMVLADESLTKEEKIEAVKLNKQNLRQRKTSS